MVAINSIGANPIIVANGGTGAATLTSGGVLIGAGTSAVTATLTPSGLTSITAASFITSSATIGTTITDNSIAVTGSTANTDLLISGKGTGGVIQSRGVAAGDLTVECTNTDNTDPASRAGFEVAVGGSSSGDPYINFLVSGAGVFTMGIDNSVSDNFVISASVALGTSDIVSITSGGTMTVTQDVVPRSLRVTGDEGTGVVSTVQFTNVVDETLGAGAGTILMKTGNPGNSSGWLKIYNGTGVRYIPYFTNISP